MAELKHDYFLIEGVKIEIYPGKILTNQEAEILKRYLKKNNG